MQELTIMDIDPNEVEFTLSEVLDTLEEQIPQDPDTNAYYEAFSASAYNCLKGEESSRTSMIYLAANFISDENFDAVYAAISLSNLGFQLATNEKDEKENTE